MAREHRGVDVVVVGSANLDLVVRTRRLPRPGETVLGTGYAEHPGGKGLNQAVAAARAGARTAFVGAVGDDGAGRRLLDVARGEGIDLDETAVVGGEPTGRAAITVDDRGENSIVVVPGANTAVVPPREIGGRVVLAQLEIPIATVAATFEDAKARGCRTVLNPAPATDLDDGLLALVDVIVPNEHEVELLGGIDRLLGAGVGTVIVTRGAAGADLVDRAGRRHVDPFPVEPIDTTGAGDAFCGALAARWARVGDLGDAVAVGVIAGALATTVAGAVPSLPTAAAIDAALTT